VQQQEQDINYSVNKTKKVAWFVSNCGARNGRLQYAHELQKHIEVSMNRLFRIVTVFKVTVDQGHLIEALIL